MTTAYIKRNDTARTLQDQLLLDGAAIDLTGATVSILFRNIITAASAKRDAVITDAATGRVEYELIAADTATAGNFRVEWEIIFADGTVLTVPDNDWHILKILEDLG